MTILAFDAPNHGASAHRDARHTADHLRGPLRQPAPWRRNLAALWFAELTAIFGFSFAFPFIPVFLREMGVRSASELAWWSGVAGGVSGLTLAIMSPVWGVLADRYGRKAMTVRAMIGGGITVGLMGLARGPLDLTLLRLAQGAMSGTIAAATALVASGTPRHMVGRALGILSSAVAVGSAFGPLVGGLAASALGVRSIFLAGGVLLLMASVPVIAVVRDVMPSPKSEARRPALEILRTAGPGTVGAVAALVACQCLLHTSFTGLQPLVVLRLIHDLQTDVAAVTGVAFAASGLGSALSATLYGGLARRYGYRSVAVAAAVLMAGSQLLTAYGPGLAAIVGGLTLTGIFFGCLGPAISAMMGLETPDAAQARVFGVGASATAIGFGIGPFMGGAVAASVGTPPAMAGCALAALLLGLVLATLVREPAR